MARFIDPVSITLAIKSPTELAELKRRYEAKVVRARNGLQLTWLRNRVVFGTAAVAQLAFAMLGFLAVARADGAMSPLSWIVGIGWLFGAFHFLGKLEVGVGLVERWRSEEQSWRDDYETSRRTLDGIRDRLVGRPF